LQVREERELASLATSIAIFGDLADLWGGDPVPAPWEPSGALVPDVN
jgi:hypothetical protein